MNFNYVREKRIFEVLELLKHEDLTYFNGEYPQVDWIGEFFREGGHVYGAFNGDELVGVIIAEDIKADGVLLWYISSKEKNVGIGSALMSAFEDSMRSDRKTWIFLNATKASKHFYEKNNFMGKKSEVYEFYKGLD